MSNVSWYARDVIVQKGQKKVVDFLFSCILIVCQLAKYDVALNWLQHLING